MFLYSYEIAQLLESKGYNIDSETYIDMMNSSPQINHITYKPFDDCFDMWSVDGEYWNYKVYKTFFCIVLFTLLENNDILFL